MPSTKKLYPPSKPHYKGLTIPQQQFVNSLVEQTKTTGRPNLTQSAFKAFNPHNDNVARNMGSEVLAKPNVREAYLIEMENSGITDSRLSATLSMALDATKIEHSPTEPDIEVPDHNIRLKAVQEAHKVKGYYPDQRLTIDKRQANINLDIKLNSNQLKNELKRLQDNISKLQE